MRRPDTQLVVADVRVDAGDSRNAVRLTPVRGAVVVELYDLMVRVEARTLALLPDRSR